MDIITSFYSSKSAAGERLGLPDEAERVCAAAYEFISHTESRVCHLWLGPLYIDVLLAGAKQAETEDRPNDATTKRRLAADLVTPYQELVSQCQSPRFTREAERLATALSTQRVSPESTNAAPLP